MKMIQNYINGELCPPRDGKYLDNINPATAKVYSQVPNSKAADTVLAIQAAKDAFPAWSQTSKLQRSEYLLKIASEIEKHFEEFAVAESIDNGKPLKLTKAIDIPRSIENLKYFAKESLNFGREIFDNQGAGDNTVYYTPLGPVATISPWNLPLYLFTWKIAPALAAGCTVVAKPSEVTPMTAFMLSKICAKILPPGVLNIVHGQGDSVGETLSSHPDILALSFTGSTQTGKKISLTAAPTMKRLHLEMGGKNPSIIFADCDMDRAIEGTLKSSYTNQGQICLCTSRIFVEKKIYEEFKTKLIEKINNLKQANPLLADTDQGAVVSKAHFHKVMKSINHAREEGGVILTGGTHITLGEENEKGYFIAPTLIENLAFDCETNQEEIFGPVATITPFETEDEVIAWANSTQYGLAGCVWSKDISRAKEVAKRIDSGILWINTWLMRDLRTPFGGMKESGRGREGGQYILKFFSKTKNICINQ